MHVKGEGMIKGYLLSILPIISSLHRYFTHWAPLPLAMPAHNFPEGNFIFTQRWATDLTLFWWWHRQLQGPSRLYWCTKIYHKIKNCMFVVFHLITELTMFSFKHRVWLSRNVLWICPWVSKGRILCQLRLKIHKEVHSNSGLVLKPWQQCTTALEEWRIPRNRIL